MGHHEPAGGNTEVTVPEGLIFGLPDCGEVGQPGGIAIDLGCRVTRIPEAAALRDRDDGEPFKKSWVV
jgi:hypothetical protein